MSLKVLIAVTHLLGAGHLTRAAAIARAFARKGHAVTLVSGGMPSGLVAFDGVAAVQLPPIRAEGTDFRSLLDAEGAPVTPALLTERRERLVARLEETRPDVVVTELFPFGRRALAGEALALLEAALALTPQPLVVSSIRDVLVAPSKPERVAETHERLKRYYDLVLVHGDPGLVPLEASWPVDEILRGMLRYTGYVDEDSRVAVTERHGILVSGGSSVASLPLYRAAVGAAHRLTDHPWRILVGNGVAETDFRELVAVAPPHASVERARPDFRALLAGTALSVSQAGYNTAVDLLRARAPSILVPFEAGRETEQRLRAERLKAAGLAEVVTESDLTAETLAFAIRASLSRPASAPLAVALDGAERSVALVEERIGPRPGLVRRLDWSVLGDALQRCHDEGRTIRFWWRDDDAVADTPALRRLLKLSARSAAPLALAVVPTRTEPSLLPALAEAPLSAAMVHGFAHIDHAPAGEKKAEFGPHRPLAAMAEEACEALRQASRLLGDGLLPVFVPPWNRMTDDLLPALARAGYRGVSAFRDRRQALAAPGLVQVNAHLDPIDWRGRRGLVDPHHLVHAIAALVERRLAASPDATEPIGLLTHHRVHDEAIWSFCGAFLDHLERNSIRLCDPVRLFSVQAGSSENAGALTP